MNIRRRPHAPPAPRPGPENLVVLNLPPAALVAVAVISAGLLALLTIAPKPQWIEPHTAAESASAALPFGPHIKATLKVAVSLAVGTAMYSALYWPCRVWASRNGYRWTRDDYDKVGDAVVWIFTRLLGIGLIGALVSRFFDW